MNSGSFFFAEISRITSSFNPAGIVSASISVTKPYLYSRWARSSAVSTLFIIAPWSNGKGSAAAAGSLHVGILKHESRLHQFVLVVQFRAGQIKQAFHVDQHPCAILFKNFVRRLRHIEVHFVLQSRTAADDHLY